MILIWDSVNTDCNGNSIILSHYEVWTQQYNPIIGTCYNDNSNAYECVKGYLPQQKILVDSPTNNFTERSPPDIPTGSVVWIWVIAVDEFGLTSQECQN